jgi:hypothetical protein
MPDPDHPSHWLMYFVAVDSAIAPAMAVGVARSLGNLFLWTADRYPLRATDSTRTHAKTVESPHVFEHENQWWLFLSVQHPRGGEPDGLPYNPVAFEWDSLGGPADTTTAQWTALDTLYNYNYPHPDPHLAYWHGSEYLPVGEHEYLAAYDDWNMGVAIGELNWYGPTDFVVGSASVANVGVPLARDAAGESVRLILLGTHPSRSGMQLGVSLPVSMRAQVTIFDVAGRRVKTIVDGDLPAGRTAAHWDGSDSNGKAVGSGVYLARLTCPWGNRIVKGVMLR